MDSNKCITRQIVYNNDNPTADYTLPNDAFTEVWCQRRATGTGTIKVNYILPSGVTINRTLSSDDYEHAHYFMGYLPKGTVLRFTEQTSLSQWGYHIYQAGN